MPSRATILIACHGPLSCNSGRHVLALGRALHARGFQVKLAAPSCGTEERQQAHPLELHSFHEWLNDPKLEKPALVHVWTPRVRMLQFHQQLSMKYQKSIPYIVHLEDNERVIAQDLLGLSRDEYEAVKTGQRTLESVPEGLMHPAQGQEFLGQAAGVTALVDTLLEEFQVEVPSGVFWPGYEPIFESADPVAALRLRARYGLAPDRLVTAYTGNVHISNQAEVRSLYQAVAELNQRGQPLTLLRTGTDFSSPIGEDDEVLSRHVIHLGEIPREELPILLRATDILIQPGEIDDWNRCRVPSKLPECLASCRPVLLPRVNLGTALTHGDNALVVDGADAKTLTQTLLEWLPRKDALLRIGLRGGVFARRTLSWERAADVVGGLYEQAL